MKVYNLLSEKIGIGMTGIKCRRDGALSAPKKRGKKTFSKPYNKSCLEQYPFFNQILGPLFAMGTVYNDAGYSYSKRAQA